MDIFFLSWTVIAFIGAHIALYSVLKPQFQTIGDPSAITEWTLQNF